MKIENSCPSCRGDRRNKKNENDTLNVKFRYGGFDGRVWWVSALCLLLTGGFVAALWMTAGGAYYLAAWVSMACAVIIALCLLSVPRRIIVGEETVELRCLVETTYIPLASIVDVEVLESGALRGKIPLVGIYGFWGYYGRYLDIRKWRIYRVYATRRNRSVVVHTTKRRYVVSCGAPEMMRQMIVNAKARNSKEM